MWTLPRHRRQIKRNPRTPKGGARKVTEVWSGVLAGLRSILYNCLEMPSKRESALTQIDAVLNRWDRFRARSEYEDCSDQSDNEIAEMIQVLASTIERVAPGSRYQRSVDDSVKRL